MARQKIKPVVLIRKGSKHSSTGEETGSTEPLSASSASDSNENSRETRTDKPPATDNAQVQQLIQALLAANAQQQRQQQQQQQLIQAILNTTGDNSNVTGNSSSLNPNSTLNQLLLTVLLKQTLETGGVGSLHPPLSVPAPSSELNAQSTVSGLVQALRLNPTTVEAPVPAPPLASPLRWHVHRSGSRANVRRVRRRPWSAS